MKMKWNKQKIKYGLRRLFLLILSAATVCVMALPVLAMTQVEAELPFTVEGASGTVRIEAEDGAPLPEVSSPERVPANLPCSIPSRTTTSTESTSFREGKRT